MHRSLRQTFRFCLLFAVASYAVSANTALDAQSNFDLDPPLQADTNSQQVIMSPDPSALPVFRFATAEVSDDGMAKVSTTAVTQTLVAPSPGSSSVSPELNPRGIIYTENVTQNYTVMVPETTTVDGKKTTIMRTETRTRTVPVKRFRKRNAEEQAEFEKKLAESKKKAAEKGEDAKPVIEPAKMVQITTPYTVTVPYTEIVDGVPTTRTRQETRTRSMQVMRGKTETKSKIVTSKYKIGDLKAYSVTGKELDQATIEERISERTPVILINDAKAIAPYFQSLLKPETIFLVCPTE
ncbi:MAG: hypothetical protein AB8B55_16605 [Mariniblastus sp.]